MSSTRISRHINAPRASVYRALIDARAVPKWKVPDGMTCQVHSFDGREGGSFRVSLTYDASTGIGKTTAHTDTYHGRFVKLVPNQEVVEVDQFETDDPAMQGEMTITITLADADGGTDLLAVHDGLPPGVSPVDNETGWRMALAKLTALVEADATNLGTMKAPIGFGTSAVLFGGGAALLAFATDVVIPRLINLTAAEPIISWFVAATLCLFVPLLLAGVWLLGGEYRYGRPWGDRLRLRSMDKRDWRLALGGLGVIGLLSGGCVALLHSLGQEQGLHPVFMAMQSVTPERAWILGAWLPFFLLNILGEELVWRGVVLPRQELAFGRRAWLVNGAGWWLMHLAFPWQVLLTLLPTVFVVPYVAQRSRNTWIGVIVHAGLNGSGFLMLAFGLA